MQLLIQCLIEKEMASWIERDDCRRLGLELIVDGIADSCLASNSAVLCYVC